MTLRTLIEVHDFFTAPDSSDGLATCDICGDEFQDISTESLEHHLKCRHPEQFKKIGDELK